MYIELTGDLVLPNNWPAGLILPPTLLKRRPSGKAAVPGDSPKATSPSVDGHVSEKYITPKSAA